MNKISLFLILCTACVFTSPADIAVADQTGMAGMHEWRKERGRWCFTNHYHSGSSGIKSSKRLAQRAALKSWWEYTAGEYGSDWANFRKSASQKKTCSRRGGGWECMVESRPCLGK